MSIVLLIVGAALLFWLQNRIYQNYWEEGLSAEIYFQGQPAVEGERAIVTETVTNRKMLPLPALTVKFQFQRDIEFENMDNASVSDRCYRSDIFSILFYQKIVRTLTINCKKRGYFTIESMDLIGSDLLMSTELVTSREQFTQLYVYPKSVNVEALDLLFQRLMGEMVLQRYLYPDPFEFRGIREYQISDPMNSINWNASARSDELMVNTYNTTNSQEIIFLLDVEDETVWKYDALHEEGIRLVAALADKFLAENILVSLFSNGRDVITKETVNLTAGTGNQQMTAIYEALARVDLTQEPMRFVEMAAELLTEKVNDAVLIFISSSQNKSTVQAFEKLALRFPGARWILPLHYEMEMKITDSGGYEVIRWEVAYES
ncbi:MAG: DUF58 domain-containing protein [Lachnospiraceae bacterium]